MTALLSAAGVPAAHLLGACLGLSCPAVESSCKLLAASLFIAAYPFERNPRVFCGTDSAISLTAGLSQWE